MKSMKVLIYNISLSVANGLSLISITVNEAFCVTGSDDGFLRLWPLDFKHVYLEAGEF